MKKVRQKRRSLKRNSHSGLDNKFLGKITFHNEDSTPISMELMQYSRNGMFRNEDLSAKPIVRNLMQDDSVNWLRVIGLSDVNRIESLCKEFGLHEFDIRDLFSEQKVTKIISYKDVVLVMTHVFLSQNNDEVEDIKVAFILGRNFVISIEGSHISLFDAIKTGIIENNLRLQERRSDYLLYILMSAVNNAVVNSVMNIEDSLLTIEDRLLDREDIPNIVHSLRSYRLDYMMMKRAMLAMREELPNLWHNANQLIDDNNLIYFNNYDDRIRATLSNLEELNELLSSLLDIYYNNNSTKMNEIMKRLTIVSTIFIPLTFLTGVWGMNFESMPGLKSEYGYLFAWGILFIVNIITLILLKKKKWF